MSDLDRKKQAQMAEYDEKKRVLASQRSNPGEIEEGGKPAMRDLLIYYARHSTMHGIPSIVGSRLYRGRRLFWCGVVCVMAVLLASVIYLQMSDFYRYPTVTSVNLRYVTEDDFPAVTVCDLNMFNKFFIEQLDERTQKQMAHLTEIAGIFHMVGNRVLEKLHKDLPDHASRESTNKTHEAILQDLLDDSINMILRGAGGLQCAWGDFHWENCSAALTARVTDMGVCFTVDTRNLVKKVVSADGVTARLPDVNPVSNAIRGLSLVVSTMTEDIPFRLYKSEGFKVVLHDHKEDPLPQSRGFVVGLNNTAEIEIQKHVRIGLEPPYKAFGTGTCMSVESPRFVNPLRRYSFYTKEACETECFVDFVVQTCACRHFLHPGNESVCPLEVLKDCFRKAEAQHYGGGATARCQCQMPCRQSVYTGTVSHAAFTTTRMYDDNPDLRSINYGVTRLHLFFPDPVVTTVEQVPVYSLEGLLGSIGGQVGLFMGFSLVTVAEMLELIFLLCTRGRRIFVEEPRRLLTNHGRNEKR